VNSTFRRTPAYHYVRVADRLPIDIDRTKDLFEVALRVRLFNPTGGDTWWLASYNPETGVAFGVAETIERKVSLINLTELVEYRGLLGLPIERDLHYSVKTIGDVMVEDAISLP
jgi:hypothetical protein